MARYIERAENTARMLDVNMQTSLMPQSGEAARKGWRALLGISELLPAFDAKYDKMTQRDVFDFMVQDRSNPSSIVSCLTQARENARAVRGTLTTEVWETHNATWLEMDARLRGGMLAQDPGEFFEWVKYRSHLSRGVTIGTTLRDESFYFIRIGTFLERTDNTARLLDVKFHDAGANMPSGEGLGQETQLDFYFWAAILRSVSAFEIYRKVYRDAITPARVAELLMLRADMPRSLVHCLNEVVTNLRHLSNEVSSDTERYAGKLHAELQFARIEDILDEGLHAYLTNFLKCVFELGQRVSRDFLVPPKAKAKAEAIPSVL